MESRCQRSEPEADKPCQGRSGARGEEEDSFLRDQPRGPVFLVFMRAVRDHRVDALCGEQLDRLLREMRTGQETLELLRICEIDLVETSAIDQPEEVCGVVAVDRQDREA